MTHSASNDRFGASAGTEPPPTPAPRRNLAKRALGLFGELCLTVGMLLVLFVGYTLFWTGVETAAAQHALTDDLVAQWQQPAPDPLTPRDAPPTAPQAPLPPAVAPPLGEGVAILRIPRFGQDYTWVIVEGTELTYLKLGPGHYVGTALPGEVGNFAVAGHRSTNGEPFAAFGDLEVGDTMTVETATAVYTYTIFYLPPPVSPRSAWAIEPNPLHLGATPTKALMTLTTCDPRWGSTHRLLVFTELTATALK